MKKRVIAIITALLLVGISSKAFSRSESSEPYQISARDKIFALHVSDSKRYWAVGNMGLILKTMDGGESWLKIESPSGDMYALNDITFVGKSGWIVGDSGLILYTQDGGNQWVKQESECPLPLMEVFFLDERRGVTVGEQGTVLWTEDGGTLWQSSPLEWLDLLPEDMIRRGMYAVNLYDVFFLDNAHGWIAGDFGTVLSSADGGKTWQLLQIGLYDALFSLYFKDESNGWAVGIGGLVIHTEDGGRSWVKQNSSVKTSLFKVLVSNNNGVVVGDLGTVLQIVNGGASWRTVELGMSAPLPWFVDAGIVSFNSPGEIICAGRGVLKLTLEEKEEK